MFGPTSPSNADSKSPFALNWHEPVRVLSIDGGGIRGVIPTLILAEVEARTSNPISSMFDLIAGTSIGGILALCLASSDASGKAAWGAAGIFKIFEQAAHEIFVPTGRSAVNGIFHNRYGHEHIESTLERYLGNRMLSEAICDVLLTSYDLSAREMVFLNSIEARQDPANDLPMRVAGRATSAAPTYFQPALTREVNPRLLLDGAVCANNPAMCAFAEVVKHKRSTEMLMVSLGTGSPGKAMGHKSVQNWGLAQWARPMFHLLLDGASDAVHRQLREMLPRDSYFRFQVELVRGSESLDNASRANIKNLVLDAQRLIRSATKELDLLCELLTR